VSQSLPTAARAVAFSPEDAGDLLAVLTAVPDPRRGGVRRHPLAYVLGVLVVAFACAGFESFVGAAQWTGGADPELLLALGAAPEPLTGAVVMPSEATIRRMATRVNAAALESVIAAWTASRLAHRAPGADRIAVAVDGKTVPGARVGQRRAPHLLSAATHDRSLVLAQRQIPSKTNEIPMATLVDDLRTAGYNPAAMVFTLDALHTQHTTTRLLECAGAGYVMTVKGNQPSLLAAVINRLREQHPTRIRQSSRGHDRTEQRHLHVVPADGIVFPGAAQVFRIIRYTGGLDGQRTRKEVVHSITNLTIQQADAHQLAALVRGHWSIENSVHWVRDVTYGEDAHRVRTGNAPAVLAAIRNTVTTALRLASAANIAAARRTATLDPRTAIRLIHLNSPEPRNRTNSRYDGTLRHEPPPCSAGQRCTTGSPTHSPWRTRGLDRQCRRRLRQPNSLTFLPPACPMLETVAVCKDHSSVSSQM